MLKRHLRGLCLLLSLCSCGDKAHGGAPTAGQASGTAGGDAGRQAAGGAGAGAGFRAPSAGHDASAGHAGQPEAGTAAPHGGMGGAGGTAGATHNMGGAGAGAMSHSLDCPAGQVWGDPLPTNRAATLVKNGNGFLFVEGPLWIPSLGVLLFSDMTSELNNSPQGPPSKIRRFTPPDKFDVLVEMSGSNGLALDNDGRVLAATHDIQSLSHFDPMTGVRESLMLRYQDKHFDSPNDLAVRSDGNIYFTDPDWQLGTRTAELNMRGVYRIAPDGSITLINGSLMQPNGIALSPDERTLYVGSLGNDVIAYPLADDGKPGTSKTFASPGSSDGMTVDCAGNIYVVSGTVEVFSSAGQKLGDISVAEVPSNVAFGGANRKTLYITAETGLYSIELNVPGRAY